MPTLHPDKVRELGSAVISTEAEAITALLARIDDSFVAACQHMIDCRGRVVVIGMGKSGHIGSKIAATLASTGTPAFFVHPGEASHGDLGMITPDDTVLALSNSGETDEILTIIPLIKRLGVPLITLTGNPESRMAREATVNIDVSVAREACPLGLAPTASTTAALVMGDALAVALLESRNFTADDFALSHPGGRLGKRLLLHVGDIMHCGDEIPVVRDDASLSEALVEMTRKGLGMTAIVDGDGRLAGIFTDGDLRRVLEKGSVNVQNAKIREHMTAGCLSLRRDMLAAAALELMDSKRVNSFPVVDDDEHLIGALNMHDLLRAGVV
ncbi:MAG TPA: KpsF/GutQ family sugar-phosphate isomerase [Gammaproteobacteria bacterium]|nr:KpsF/GutQ family sugar-phosphate isomerase [Gammaproteobacteria bacterium]